ncbi:MULTISPECIES: ADP-ribosylglycohydrolase [Bacillaceae]|uniref:ADP-ribosylglycohydrolase n=1 Tax=Bacillaceae TaxID=186817 RepID=UPI000A92A726|nr:MULTISPECIES: ADP-ribosylglycohydrolase [Bacillaceae]MCF7620643.1 ADP-ribosylglycohydrolase [Peribacillus frigoritolerans]MCP1095109.1 ADP-ribosylglycohydrolase [Bacillaceae bacterium OS4b]MEA3575074.1 ADP-ribosylglycohydrolase [Peribacillus frigoritolerans]
MVDRWEDDNKNFMSLAIKKRVLPSLYGGNIGDILGVQVPENRKLRKVLDQQEVE